MRARLSGLVLAMLLTAGVSARAQGGNAAAAEALFQEGRKLYQDGKFEEACPKLAESQRLDPATGTLLSLALCHEAQKRFATAWAEFNDAEARARLDNRADRAALAREHITALEPRLSKLTVDVPAEVASTPGFEVRVDGVVTGPGSYGVAVPVDGGEHRVEASAPGKLPFRTTVVVKEEADRARVIVPALVDAASAPPEASPLTGAAVGSPAPSKSGSGLRTAGLVTAGAGVVGLAVGTVLGLSAKSAYDEAVEDCTAGVCPDPAYDDAESARSQGNVATVVFVLGGAALATGAVLFFVAPSSPKEHAALPLAPRLQRVGFGTQGLFARGTF